jgi:hypothetical protein
LDRLFALGFPFDFGVGVGFRVGFGVVARDFGLDPLLAVDEAFAASGGLEALRVLLDLRRGGFDEEASAAFASPAGVVGVPSGSDLTTFFFPSFFAFAFHFPRHSATTLVHFCLRARHNSQAKFPP